MPQAAGLRKVRKLQYTIFGRLCKGKSPPESIKNFFQRHPMAARSIGVWRDSTVGAAISRPLSFRQRECFRLSEMLRNLNAFGRLIAAPTVAMQRVWKSANTNLSACCVKTGSGWGAVRGDTAIANWVLRRVALRGEDGIYV